MLRWCAAGMTEATKQFRRVNGHLHLRALQPRSNGTSPPKMPKPHQRQHRLMITGPSPKLYELRDILSIS
jgi:hypothetical protein